MVSLTHKSPHSVSYLFRSIVVAVVMVVAFTFAGFIGGLVYGLVDEAATVGSPPAFTGAFLGTNISAPAAIVYLTWRSRRSKKLSIITAVLMLGLIAFWILAITDRIPNTFKPF